jgi:hypothetical protein
MECTTQENVVDNLKRQSMSIHVFNSKQFSKQIIPHVQQTLFSQDKSHKKWRIPLRILVLLWGPLNAKNFPVEMKKNYGEENENWFIIY